MMAAVPGFLRRTDDLSANCQDSGPGAKLVAICSLENSALVSASPGLS